ncbi:D-amino-acid transaminase [Bacillaceae bacterium Marseille-Q3522]|nr:D-amino-acid transaminase [Bacillaceae bacterium Marseille-Q3522]
MQVIINGKFIERGQAKVDIEDRGFQFGDGVYEVIRVYNGKLFTAKEHLQRLAASCEAISLHVSKQMEHLQEMLEKLIEKNQVNTGIVYMQFTRGAAPRNHLFPDATVATYIVTTKELPRPVKAMTEGIEAILQEDIRWLRCDIKSLNLLGNVLARQKAQEAGCQEAILHRGDIVTEGSHTNVAIVKDDTIYTHPADHFILNGISRQKLIGLCQKHRIPLKEAAFSVEDLTKADEVFITGTTTEVTPVITVDGKPVNGGKIGEVTRKLQKLFETAIIEECEAVLY